MTICDTKACIFYIDLLNLTRIMANQHFNVYYEIITADHATLRAISEFSEVNSISQLISLNDSG